MRHAVQWRPYCFFRKDFLDFPKLAYENTKELSFLLDQHNTTCKIPPFSPRLFLSTFSVAHSALAVLLQQLVESPPLALAVGSPYVLVRRPGRGASGRLGWAAPMAHRKVSLPLP
eukprot:COSAG01_NODE_10393_length_2177_cov_2.759865_3_plen_114_part_01